MTSHPADYWLRDAAGRILGPIGFAVLKDLVLAGRLSGIEQVSHDGQQWVPAARVSEVAELLARKTRADDDKIEAARLRQIIDQMTGKPAHEVFGVDAGADLDTLRSTFFFLAKRYHPERLPPDTHPDLRAATDEMFHFLAQVMAKVDREHRPTAGPSQEEAGEARPYRAVDFVGLSRMGDGVARANVRVTVTNAGGLFADHPVMNLSAGAVFLPAAEHLPMGTVVELTFHFPDPPRELKTRGKVIFESKAIGKQVAGIGLKLLTLREEELAFIRAFLGSLQRR